MVAVWTAWDDGGGHRWTQATATFIVLALIPAGCAVAWFQGFRRTPPYVFLALACWLFAAAQCVPLPAGLVGVLSPASLEAYRDWLPDTIRDEAASISGSPAATIAQSAIPISVSPTFTRMALSLPILFAAGCWLSSLCFANRRAALVLLVIPAIAGGIFAFFGLADMIRLARDSDVELRQRLIITPVGADGPFGPFINNNTCAGYLNLTIGCALGLLLGLRHRAKEDRRSGTLYYFLCAICMLLIVVMVAGILGSDSRGGFLGLAFATAVLTLLATRGWSRIGLAAALALMAFGAVYFLDELGIRDRTSKRLETLYDGTAQKDPRLGIWQDGLDASLRHLPLGAGFGAYRYATLPFQSRTGDHWAVNADGMHVEWLLEGGIWLIPLMVVGFVMVVRDTRRLTQRIPDLPLADARLARAVTIATTFSLASLVVTQSFDFGITHLPLLLTIAILIGGVYRLRVATASQEAPRKWIHSARVSGVTAVAITAMTALAAWDLHSGGTWQRMMIERYSERRVPIHERKELDGKIDQLNKLVQQHPGDAMAHRTLAQLILDRQHQLGAIALLDAKAVDANSVTSWASPSNVRKASHNYDMDLQALMLRDQDPEEWRRARRHAVTALVLSPLDDRSRVLLVETDFVQQGSETSSGPLLEQIARLRPKDLNILEYIEALADVYPSGDTLDQIQSIKRKRRSKK